MDMTTGPNASLELLDSEISAIQAEIKNLRNRHRLLSASLLSSSYVRDCIQSHPSIETDGDVSPLVVSAGKHRESNYHRIAFSATTFPFKDPSPHAGAPHLLGVRIDVCSWDGKFEKPYYVLLHRENTEDRRLRVHRHTIPAFISIERLEQKYLPPPLPEPDGEHEASKPWKNRKQDLPALVRHLRRELAAWHLRRAAIEWLRQRLGFFDEGEEDQESLTSRAVTHVARQTGIVSLVPVTLEARYARLEWDDGRVGRFKISNSGLVERAVVIGDHGRDMHTEAAMVSGDRRIETILERLSQNDQSASRDFTSAPGTKSEPIPPRESGSKDLT
ncbi:Cenp-O kinetochore centromere component domain containing protein [Elaphomyces granulatus]|jgi:central kinetochore subunit Mal2/MCM21